MSRLSDRDPKHWHDENGNHRMPDPRKLARPESIIQNGEIVGTTGGQSKAIICAGDSDLAEYWDHLDEHDRQAAMPERRDDDSSAVRALFDKLEHNRRENETLIQLINDYRITGR
jgi:hypothetical protein